MHIKTLIEMHTKLYRPQKCIQTRQSSHKDKRDLNKMCVCVYVYVYVCVCVCVCVFVCVCVIEIDR